MVAQKNNVALVLIQEYQKLTSSSYMLEIDENNGEMELLKILSHNEEKFQSWALFTNIRCIRGNEGGHYLRNQCRE